MEQSAVTLYFESDNCNHSGVTATLKPNQFVKSNLITLESCDEAGGLLFCQLSSQLQRTCTC